MLARARGELLVERERRDGAGRVVRVADPEERDLVPRVERVEVGQPAVAPRAAARSTTDAAGEERAALVDRVARARGSRRARFSPSATCANEKIASFEPSVGTISRRGSTSTPKRRPIQPAIASRSSGSPVARGYDETSSTEASSASRMNARRHLARVAHPEVDQLDAARAAPRPSSRRAARTDTARARRGRGRAARSDAYRARKRCSAANVRSSSAISTCSSTACA